MFDGCELAIEVDDMVMLEGKHLGDEEVLGGSIVVEEGAEDRIHDDLLLPVLHLRGFRRLPRNIIIHQKYIINPLSPAPSTFNNSTWRQFSPHEICTPIN